MLVHFGGDQGDAKLVTDRLQEETGRRRENQIIAALLCQIPFAEAFFVLVPEFVNRCVNILYGGKKGKELLLELFCAL